MKIIATVKAIKFRKDDFAIVTLNKIECDNKAAQKRLGRTCDCKLNITCLFEDDVLELEATIEKGRYGEPVLNATIAKTVTDSNESAVLQFLKTRACMKPAQAKKTIKELGLGAVKAIIANIHCLDFLKLKAGEAEKIQNNLKKYTGFDEVALYLKIAGIPISKADRIVAEYGGLALTTLKHTPYRLTYKNVLEFAECDKLAKILNYEANNEYRLQSILYCFLDYNFSTLGSVYVNKSDLNILANQYVELYGVFKDEVDLTEVLKTETKKSYIIDDNGKIYKKYIYDLECQTVDKVRERLNSIMFDKNKIYDDEVYQEVLDDDQKAAVVNSLTHQFSLIAGFAGAGKTTTAKTVIRIAEKAGLTVRCLAPTGKASERMSEATGKRAETIHRALKLQVDSYETEETLTEDLIIVDEATMIDLQLFNCLLTHTWGDSQIILMGDPAQLPSVGGGNVFADLLKATIIPSMTLSKVHRQAGESGILRLATQIRNGEELDLNETSDLKIKKSRQVIKTTQEIYNKLSGLGSVCVLSCTKKTVESINDLIQTQNNNAEYDFENIRLKENDKIIVTVNDYEKDVYNGDVGEVEAITDNILIRFGKDRVIEFGFDEVDKLQLAYALTVHKSQGSEYDYVIFVADNRQSIMLNKNILYTAVTRAKRGLYIIIEDEEMIREKAHVSAENNRLSQLALKLC